MKLTYVDYNGYTFQPKQNNFTFEWIYMWGYGLIEQSSYHLIFLHLKYLGMATTTLIVQDDTTYLGLHNGSYRQFPEKKLHLVGLTVCLVNFVMIGTFCSLVRLNGQSETRWWVWRMTIMVEGLMNLGQWIVCSTTSLPGKPFDNMVKNKIEKYQCSYNASKVL